MPVQKTCPICNKTFYIRLCKAEQRKFCSRECYKKSVYGEGNPSYKNAKREKDCEYCGKEFSYFPSVRKDAKFCSRSCLAKSRLGENASNWKGGHKQYYGNNWIFKREKARQRDNYTCQNCGIKEKDLGRELDVHHIKPFDVCENYQEANNINNLMSLCYSCHHIIEKESRRIYGISMRQPNEDFYNTDNLSPKEAGKLLGVSTWMIYKHIANGTIKAANLSGGLARVRPRFIISKEEIDKFLHK